MRKFHKALSCVLLLCLLASVAFVSTGAAVLDASAATVDYEEVAASGIVIHYKSEKGVPSVYYWNSLPQNIEVDYPGDAMQADSSQGSGWYTATFPSVTKINLMFVVDGEQSAELTRNGTGEYWYKGSKWYTKNPETIDTYDRTDMRQDTIYFVITSRFYDGDTGNNVHCWDDSEANNPDSDPAWRGDFKGLIEKLDYIKALGFSAIWITPVVENCSGYDYHGYHASDFSKVDPRNESSDTDFQALIDAVHEKDMKIVQDVVWNHTSNFGEAFLAPMFTKEYSSIQDLASIDCLKMVEGSALQKAYPNYDSLIPNAQYDARIATMKEDQNDTNNYYHHDKSLSYGSYTEQTGQMAGDCVDINTENPVVADYLTSTYMEYVNMGVDCFRLDTEKHVNRLTLNNAYFPVFSEVENFYIFGEVCARRREVVNEGGLSDSCFFYSWKEPSGEASWSSDWKTNYDNAVAHFGKYQTTSPDRTSDNAFLNGNSYHTPDYSQWNGTSTIDFPMHWNFYNAQDAFGVAVGGDAYYNDATWNVVYVDSHDYSPDDCQTVRYNGGTAKWAENCSLMFTFRGIPCLYYGSEVEFMKGAEIDVGPKQPLAKTGRAYFGDSLEGTVTATDFSEYSASGTVADTLNNPLSKHIQRLNQIRREIPALQMGQYSTDGCSGSMSYKRRYTNAADGIDSYALVTVSGGSTFTGVENGTYYEAVTGKSVTVTNGTLTSDSIGQGNIRVYVLDTASNTVKGKIGTDGTYLK